MASGRNWRVPAARCSTATAAAYGMLNCASTIEVGRRFSASGSATMLHPASSTPTRTRAMESGARSCWRTRVRIASIGAWLYRQHAYALMLVVWIARGDAPRPAVSSPASGVSV